MGRRLTEQIRDIPLLTPMTIVGAKYNDRYDFIVWKTSTEWWTRSAKRIQISR
jgi:hypothetical protein